MTEQDLSTKQRSCYKCGYFADTSEIACPQCNRPLFTTTSTRIRGGLLVAIGLILVVFIGYLFDWAFRAFNNSSPTGSRFTGTQQEKLMIVGIFSLLIIFGLFSVATGGWQVLFGRRNRILAWSVAGIGVLLAISAGCIVWFFG